MSSNNTIYHYCSVDTFNLVISNKCIRASDLNKTNDYMEKKWAFNMFLNIVQDELEKLGVRINLDENYQYWSGINSHRKYLEREISSYMNSSDPILITCFSKEGDKLSQWRAYGQDGFGVAIGFDLDKIRLLRDKNDIKVENVIYKEERQVRVISKAIKQSVKYMKELFDGYPSKIMDNFNEFFKDEFDSFCEVIVDKLEEISCYIKNPAFIEEEEIRIIYAPNLDIESFDCKQTEEYFKKIKKVDKYKVNPIKYCSKNDRLVAYSDINFNDFISGNIISEIVLGPKSKLKEDDIFYFLLSSGYNDSNIKVRRSEATYR